MDDAAVFTARILNVYVFNISVRTQGAFPSLKLNILK